MHPGNQGLAVYGIRRQVVLGLFTMPPLRLSPHMDTPRSRKAMRQVYRWLMILSSPASSSRAAVTTA